MEISPTQILNTIFKSRKKTKYNPLSSEIKEYALEILEKNPSISHFEIRNIEQNLKLPKNKLRNFFKNQKIKNFKTTKTANKEFKSYQLFNKQDKEILEEYFRKNNKLTQETLVNLKKVLSITNTLKITKWYDYRNLKKKKLIENDPNIKPMITKKENIVTNQNFQKDLFIDEKKNNFLNHQNLNLNLGYFFPTTLIQFYMIPTPKYF